MKEIHGAPQWAQRVIDYLDMHREKAPEVTVGMASPNKLVVRRLKPLSFAGDVSIWLKAAGFGNGGDLKRPLPNVFHHWQDEHENGWTVEVTCPK